MVSISSSLGIVPSIKPSTTHKGSVLPVMELVPLMRILPPDTFTPAVLPCSASVIPPGAFSTSSGFKVAIEDVRSAFFCFPQHYQEHVQHRSFVSKFPSDF